MIRWFSSNNTMSTNTYPGQSFRVDTVFFWLRTSTTFSIGTRTSLMKSCISSGLMRFSMLSLTFCSWPESVWMTNHWLRMGLKIEEGEHQDAVYRDSKNPEQRNGERH